MLQLCLVVLANDLTKIADIKNLWNMTIEAFPHLRAVCSQSLGGKGPGLCLQFTGAAEFTKDGFSLFLLHKTELTNDKPLILQNLKLS